MKKNKLFLLLLVFTLTGCENATIMPSHIVPCKFINDEVLFPMNTITQLKMYYESQYDDIVDDFDDMVWKLSQDVDRYHNYENVNNLKTINDSCGSNEAIKVSDELFEVLSLGVDLTKLTCGKFNLAMGSIIDLYSEYLQEGITQSYDAFPISEESIETALNAIPNYTKIDDYIVLDENEKTVTLNKFNGNNVIISLGAIAKGFVMQKVYDYIKSFNYTALIDSGSSTMATIGKNPISSNKKWSILFRSPSLNIKDDYLCNINITGDSFISTSSDEQQNFLYKDANGNNRLMHHIIDSTTGKSNNFLRSVSLISFDASLALLDALSTALFNCKSNEEIYELIDTIKENYSCNISFILGKTIFDNNQINVDKFEIDVSESFNKYVVSEYATNATKINVIKNY